MAEWFHTPHPRPLEAREVLGRRLNPRTMVWEAPGLESISAEVMEQILRPGATLGDLLGVLQARDAAARARAINDA